MQAFKPRKKNIHYNEREGMCLLFFSLKGAFTMLESVFKRNLIEEIEDMFPGCFVLHLDANEIQGIPDILILYGNKWAMLEGKRSKNSPCQSNQGYYIECLNALSFARFIYPENKEEVLNELQRTFRHRRNARLPRC